jgi:hypothetical protein
VGSYNTSNNGQQLDLTTALPHFCIFSSQIAQTFHLSGLKRILVNPEIDFQEMYLVLLLVGDCQKEKIKDPYFY